MNVSTSTIEQPRRKPNQSNIANEDASVLNLGREFDLNQISHDGTISQLITLNNSETRLLINAALKQRRKEEAGASFDDDDINDDDEDEDFSNSNEVLRKTQEYLSVFSRFKNEETITAVENLLKSPENQGLHPFELAQLGSLACEEAEEAKTLIPSLAKKKTDDELQLLLSQLNKLG